MRAPTGRLRLLARLATLALALGAAAEASCANGSDDNESADATGVGPTNEDATVSGEGSSDDAVSPEGSPDEDSGCGNTMTSPQNCGSCGHACETGMMCSQGQCGLECAAPEIQCGGDGGAPLFDAGQQEAGDGGEGGVPASDAGTGPATPYCANTSDDPSNCGACGKSCGANHVCTAAACVLSCPTGTTACPSGNVCIPEGTCCTSADCADAGGGACTGPGGTCGCAPADTLGTSCALATSAGSLAVGGSVTESGSLSAAGEENWVQVTFTGNTSLTYHPHIKLSTNPNSEYVFDLMTSCSSAAIPCTEGGTCTSKTEWEVYYTATLTQRDVSSGSFVDIPAVGTDGQLWIRVHRASGTPSCDAFELTITN